MSEVYIRSQNKEKLYRLGGNYACVEYGEYEDIKKKRGGAEADKKRHVICISDGCLEEIGEYATKERCLEVLDEIQKACVSYLFRAYAYRFTPQKRGVSMGEFNTVGLEDIIDAFSRREAATVEAVPKMLKAGADVLIEAQRAEAQAMGLNETGGFINSIKATDVKGDDTEKYVEIYPQGRAKHGNDRKGDKSKVRYATIGFVAEYGTSSHAARPYMTVANEKAHEKVVEAQRSIWESETGE